MNAIYKKALLAVMVFPLAFSTVYAKNGHKNNSNTMPLVKMLKQVDLTAEQKESVESLIKEYRLANKGELHEDMMAILKAEKFDVKKAKALIASREALKEQKQLKRLQMRHDIYQLLTAEQQAKMELLISMEQNKSFKRGKMNRGQGDGKGYFNDDQKSLD